MAQSNPQRPVADQARSRLPIDLFVASADRDFQAQIIAAQEALNATAFICDNTETCLNKLEVLTPKIICIDISITDETFVEKIKQLGHYFPNVLLIYICDDRPEHYRRMLSAMQVRGFDYHSKPCEATKLQASLRNALHEYDLRERLCRLEQDFGALLQRSDLLNNLGYTSGDIDHMGALLCHERFLFLPFEVENQKHTVDLCRMLHHLGDRAPGPFLHIQCGQLPHGMHESELFGHQMGAFIGAVTDMKGAFEQGAQGTVVLDEYTHLSPAIQRRIYDVIAHRQVTPLGSNSRRHIDTALILTSRFEPDALARQGLIDLALHALIQQCYGVNDTET